VNNCEQFAADSIDCGPQRAVEDLRRLERLSVDGEQGNHERQTEDVDEDVRKTGRSDTR